MINTKAFLKRIEMFIDLTDAQFNAVAKLCTPQTLPPETTIIERNSPPDNFYLIQTGTVEIITAPDNDETHGDGVIVTLGEGQSFGEMALVDSGKRSATVRTGETVELLSINCTDFLALCQADTDLGFKVMRNIAVDLSFKLRYRNLI